jgi:hypothetical protein
MNLPGTSLNTDALACIFTVVNAKVEPTKLTCPSLVVLLTIFYEAAGVWTTAIGFHLVWKSEGRKSSLALEIIYLVVSLGVPVVIALQQISVTNIQPSPGTTKMECFVTYTLLMAYSFGLRKLFLFIFNAIFVGIIISKLKQNKGWTDNLKKSKTASLLFIQFCYLLYSTSGVLTLAGASPTVNSTVGIHAAMIIAATQGLFNGLIVLRKPIMDKLIVAYMFFKRKPTNGVNSCQNGIELSASINNLNNIQAERRLSYGSIPSNSASRAYSV